jgi:hypothetical protein
MFIILATVVLADAALRLERSKDESVTTALATSRLPHRDLGYADDTLLLETIFKMLQAWFSAVERTTDTYQLYMNRKKQLPMVMTGGSRYYGTVSSAKARRQGALRATITRAANRAVKAGQDPQVATQSAQAAQDAKQRREQQQHREGRFGTSAGTTKSLRSSKPTSGRIVYNDGEIMTQARVAKYLGVQVNENLEYKEEQYTRAQQVFQRLGQYRTVVKGSKVSKRRRVNVYNSVHRRILVQSAHLMHHTKADERRQVATQVK